MNLLTFWRTQQLLKIQQTITKSQHKRLVALQRFNLLGLAVIGALNGVLWLVIYIRLVALLGVGI